MRRGLPALVLSLLPTVVFAQTGAVTGTVTNSATGAPVGNARVSLCMQLASSFSCSSASTNASGVYSRTLAPGTYYAYTSNSSLINEVFDNLPCPASACSAFFAVANGASIIVTAGATLSGRDFALDPGGSIAGTITDAASSAPVQSV
jgi:hypothetical protein